MTRGASFRGSAWRAQRLAVSTLILYPAFILRSSKAAPTGRDSTAQGAAKRSPGSSDLTTRSPNGARFLKRSHGKTERGASGPLKNHVYAEPRPSGTDFVAGVSRAVPLPHGRGSVFQRASWYRIRREAERLLTPVVLRCSQKESRPLGALRLTNPC